jgi:hypothetical protein
MIVGLRAGPQAENIEIEKIASGGRCQWVLDAASQTVEWLGQPLRFECVVLRKALDLCWSRRMKLFEKQRTDWQFAEPRLTSGAFDV